MKKLILLFVLVSGFAFGQIIPPPSNAPKILEFRFINEKMNENVVLNFNNIKKDVIYKKSIDWIKKTFVNSDKVILTNIENEMIRFQGISSNSLNISELHPSDGLYYQIQIDIKDNKMKITPQSLKMIDEDNKKYQLDIPLKEKYSETYYGRTISYSFSDVPKVLNNLINSLSDHINGKTKNDDW